jgi:CRP-like cAMP-binding protein
MSHAFSSSAKLSDAAETILEARSDPRVGVEFPVQVLSDDFSGPLRAGARDLSVGGLCIATNSMFSFRSIRSVQLDLPSGPFKLKAEGRWQSESTADDSRLTGVCFEDVESEDLSSLWELVQDTSKELALFLYDRSALSDLSSDDANNLAGCTRYRLVAPRGRIYRQDECRPGDDSIFLVVRGEVSLMVRLLDSRREVTLERLTAGGLFGGLPAIADVPNQESAVADAACTLLEISRPCLSFLRASKPLLAQRLMQIITRNYVLRSRRLVELASLSS